MDIFKVWVTRMDGLTHVSVVDLENAKWLLARLSNSFVFKTCEPFRVIANPSAYTFRVAHNSQMSASHFEQLLAKISEVKMSTEPQDVPIVSRAMPIA